MMSAPLHTEKSIFLEAAEIASPIERAAFLERSCGDDGQLRAAVEALLLSHQRSQGVLDATAAPLAEHTETIIAPTNSCNKSAKGAWAPSSWPSKRNLYNVWTIKELIERAARESQWPTKRVRAPENRLIDLWD